MVLAERSVESRLGAHAAVAPRVALLERRQRLTLVPAARHPEVAVLLREVDAALDRLERHEYGRCEGCHDPIEPRVLEAEPAARFCLDCMDVDERRRLGRDLELASEFQAALLPPADLHLGGWELAVHYQPLGPLGGDTCDLIVPGDANGAFHFLLGDVAGKGVSASLLMAHLHALFRSMIALGLPLAGAMERVNRLFSQSTTNTAYATAVAGRVDASGRVELCNAGHPAPLLLRSDATRGASPSGLPLGLFPGAEYRSFTLELAPGEGLLLYTDGLSEAADAAGEEYGRERILQTLRREGATSARQALAGVLADLGRFRGSAPPNDDLTVLALRRERAARS